MENKKNKDIEIVFSVPNHDQDHSVIIFSSEPLNSEYELFDGPILSDNIGNIEDIPKEPGLYSGMLNIRDSKYWTDCGYEYDLDITLRNIQKIDFNFKDLINGTDRLSRLF
jgi:hypothetical protein